MPIIVCVNCKKKINSERINQVYCGAPNCQKARKKNAKKIRKQAKSIPSIKQVSTIKTKKENIVIAKKAPVAKVLKMEQPDTQKIKDLELKLAAIQATNAELRQELKEVRHYFVTLRGLYQIDRETGNM